MPCAVHVISWTELLLPQAAAWLCAGLRETPWDLSGTLIVVPTRQSGRRLRAELAEQARARGTGLLAPRIVTPEWLETAVAPEGPGSASEMLAVWAGVLLTQDLDEIRALVPLDPPRRDAAWALGFADQLSRMKAELGRALLDFEGVAGRTAGTEYEPERWQALARLEARWRERLAERSLEDPLIALRKGVETATPPPDIRRIVLLAVPDLSKAAEAVLARWAATLNVQVVVQGDPERTFHDAWGRPVRESSMPPLKLRSERCAIRSLKDPGELAERVAALAQAYSETPGSLAVTLVDPNLVPGAAAAFEARGLRPHDPAGVPLARSAVGKFVKTLAGLAASDALRAVGLLARSPAFCAYAAGRRGWFDHPAAFSVELDRLLEARLPSDLDAAVAAAQAEKQDGLRQALEWAAAVAQRFGRDSFARTLTDTAAEVLGDTRRSPQAGLEEEAADALSAGLAALMALETRHAGLPREFWPALLGRTLQTTRLYPSKPDDSWDLQGWVELAFDASPHAVLCGFNEGAVPETVRGDAFMPDTLRRHLELDSNERRFARDRLLLEAAVRSRSRSGRVDILVPKIGTEGDPLQPSRLLFACADDDLVSTARYLFEPLPPPRPKPPRMLPWTLRPLPATLGPSLSPSAIRAYLDCPFRFYLEYGLRARTIDPDKRDLDARDFGTLCHAAFEAMARDTVMREVEDEAMLAEFLVSQLNATAAERFGRIRSFAVKLQLEAAAARLRAAASVEAAQRREGWRTIETERAWSLQLEGHRFNGVIDRIDRHKDGRIRVLDYKTADTAKSPRDTHWGSIPSSSEHLLAEARLDVEGRSKRWTDLQLPLYVLAVKAMTQEDASAGYFILPKTKEETEIRLWEELTPERLTEAAGCAVAVSKAVRGGRFWPPAPRRSWDEACEALFPEGIEASVSPGPFEIQEGGRA